MADQIKRDVNLTELQSVLPNVSRPLGDELHNKDAGKNLTFLLPSNDALRKLVGMMTPQQQQQQMSAMPAGGQQQPGAQQQQPAPPAGGPNKPELLTNGTALTAVLSYHILEGRYALSDFRDGMKINTMLGPQAGPLTVSVRDDKVTFIGAGSACPCPCSDRMSMKECNSGMRRACGAASHYGCLLLSAAAASPPLGDSGGKKTDSPSIQATPPS